MTIIASIHSPNDETLHLFESLYVLAKGGVPVFEGPPNQIKATLERVLPRMTVPADQPPIEMLLKIACTGKDTVSCLGARSTKRFRFFRALRPKGSQTSQALQTKGRKRDFESENRNRQQ